MADRIQFYNQDDALGAICSSQAESSIFIVDALPEYGKSRLLEKIAEHFEEQKWYCFTVRLQSNDDESRIIAKLASAILDKVTGRLRNSIITSADDIGRGVNNIRKNVIFLIDDFKSELENVDDWLIEHLAPSLLSSTAFERRVVFAGTQVLAPRKRNGQRHYCSWSSQVPRVTLKALERKFIVKSLFDEFKKQNRPLDKDAAKKFIVFVTKFSAGHPGIVESLVKYLGNGNTIPVNRENERRAFDEHVKDRYKKIIDAIPGDNNLNSNLELLTTLRYLDVRYLIPFQKQCEERRSALTHSDIQYVDDWGEAIFTLSEYHLLERIGNVRKLDPTLRVLAQFHLQTFHPDRFRILHQIAQGIFEKQLLPSNLPNPDSKLEVEPIIQEAFYHCLQAAKESVGSTNSVLNCLVLCIKAMRHIHGSNPRDDCHIGLLAELLLSDLDIRNAIDGLNLKIEDLLWAACDRVNQELKPTPESQDVEIIPIPASSQAQIHDPDPLKPYTNGLCAVLNDFEEIAGTSFISWYNDQPYIITCSHVLENAGKGLHDRVTLLHFDDGIGRLRAQVAHTGVSTKEAPADNLTATLLTAENDIAVLRLVDPIQTLGSLDLLPLANEEHKPGECEFYGYAESLRQYGDWVKVMPTYPHQSSFFEVSVIGDGKIERGMSGAPVVDLIGGCIVGMVQAFIKDGKSGLMAPANLIRKVLGGVPRSGEGGDQ